MKVSVKTLRAAAQRAIAAQGFNAADSEVILDILMYAQFAR